jgi:hypothetical protein
MSFDERKLIAKLMELKDDLFHIAEKKYEEIEILQEEIRHLEKRMKEIEDLIGLDNIVDAESFLQQKRDEKIKNVEQSRTIFSPTNTQLVLIKLKYDGKKLEVIFPNPELIRLKQQSSAFIEHVLQPLFPLKEKEKDMDVVVESINDLGMVNKILINNLYKVENIDEVYKVFRNLVEQV